MLITEELMLSKCVAGDDSLYQKKTKKCNIIAIIFQHLKNFKDILDLLSPVLDLYPYLLGLVL